MFVHSSGKYIYFNTKMLPLQPVSSKRNHQVAPTILFALYGIERFFVVRAGELPSVSARTKADRKRSD